MFVRIETSSGVPITRQIMDQIRTQCITGDLSPGSKLPSVRVLARQLTVNQNTILRVYERLTAEGLLERKHGDGTYVADSIDGNQIKSQQKLLKQEAEKLVHHAALLGLSIDDLHRFIDQAEIHVNLPAKKKEE